MTDTRLVTIPRQKLYAETDNAVLIGPPGLPPYEETGKQWIPSSLIEHNDWNGIGTVSDIEVPLWLADDRDLDYEEQ